MAEQAEKHNALLLHYSTDYVFDGTKHQPYTEEDTPNPINAYGRGKLAGEEAIRHSGCEHLIVRTSWVYSIHGNNFLNTMLGLMKEREQLSVVNDQQGAPTSVNLIASTTLEMLKAWNHDRQQGGARAANTYHLTAAGQTTWYGFAEHIRILYGQHHPTQTFKIKNISPITSEDYRTTAARPADSRLCCDKLTKLLNLRIPEWQSLLNSTIIHLLDTQNEIYTTRSQHDEQSG